MDDLQFQLEEKEVISGDQLESATETNVQTVTNLTKELEEERRLTQQLRDELKVLCCMYQQVGNCMCDSNNVKRSCINKSMKANLGLLQYRIK